MAVRGRRIENFDEFGFLEPVCCKKRAKNVPTKKLVWGIGDLFYPLQPFSFHHFTMRHPVCRQFGKEVLEMVPCFNTELLGVKTNCNSFEKNFILRKRRLFDKSEDHSKLLQIDLIWP